MSLASPLYGRRIGEKSSVSELILPLRSAFQPSDFDKVESIFKAREEKMKTNVYNWRKKYELMEEKHGELALASLDIEIELNKYKQECEFLRRENTRFQAGRSSQFDQEKKAEASHAKLLEAFTKIEAENRELRIKNAELERKLQVYMKGFEALSVRILRLEKDTNTLMTGVRESQKDLERVHLASAKMVGDKETSDDVKPEDEDGVGTGSRDLAHSQVKENISNCLKKDQSLAVAGFSSDSLNVGNDCFPEEGAGLHSVIMACDNAGKSIQKHLVSEREISNKVIDTSPAADQGMASEIIEINDSDDEMLIRHGMTSEQNILISSAILRDKEIEGAGVVLENGRSYEENSLLPSSTKRKRSPSTNICETRNDDDISPSGKCKMGTFQKFIRDRIDSSSNGDSSSSDSGSSGTGNLIAIIQQASEKRCSSTGMPKGN